MDALQEIQSPISAEMEKYKKTFDSFLVHSNPLLHEILQRIGRRKGKMMRPLLTLLVAKLFSEIQEKTLYTACTFEYFHTASLVHDDVVDESGERRGVESVNNAYNNKIAVLVGDFLLSNALLCAYHNNNMELIRITSCAAQNLANGELLQLNNVQRDEISEKSYFEVIKGKTAALFSACAEAGAIDSGASGKDIRNMARFGEIIGLCFQIRDDIFDYVGGDEIGKPTGNDMKEGKLTLPVIHALYKAGSDEMFGLAKRVKALEATHEDIDRLVKFTLENGGIDYSWEVMNRYAEEAKSLLDVYAESDVKTSLLRYVDYVIQRDI